MPRAVQSAEARVLAFFKTAPLIVAGVVLRLASDQVKERNDHAAKAGAGARKALAQKKRATPPAPGPSPVPSTPRKATAKKGGKKKGAGKLPGTPVDQSITG